MNSIHQSGLNIVNQAFYTAAESSQAIAEAVVEPESESSMSAPGTTSLTEAVVDLKKAEIMSLAGAKVIRTADEVVGTLIDTKV
ncbi:hypothetical protein GCM10011369_33430 [Neiella marina]|uniref:Flagellar basal-body/hook protein C-terminal domain-containing protein n=1 Tax=Neiella marina TaxID=508461 RepID=A0A8J2U9U9_9GAMM|nr:hypothetical protein [Neiella marina]GGA88598.1 hypothetical protein GCM10011369_33430 [Neiella marina]